ncbi:glycoside hydrolase family 43 protein [Actinocrinis puniceicyclus]|uniref:Glycoside hydrolase family 43 protein n=1 Tax=Actinocrinis puniceicyclus TaxID=977794 RepID=A0A8J8BDK7_9ACTN|nr:glycoside hydrolase family 43 protein [Actinocrinis puniceicyclus]MBS2966337.1 glycoside hydrolase family 43 protein [Actinocrinis puniceicyclus]
MTSSTSESVTGRGLQDPVIPGFHPDPSVCRVGADYYLACSSFEYFPGVPLFHSRDLASWKQIGNILDRPGQLPLLAAGSSGGVYAPTLRHHAGRFWMVTTNVSAQGHMIVNAVDPVGPWSDPVHVEGLPGIDPDLAWDEEGVCRLSYTTGPDDGRPGGIWQAAVDPYNGRLLEDPRWLWAGTAMAYPEAPHLYHINGLWYLLIAEGGTERGHCVSVARAPRPWGPFESCPANPIFTHRSTDSPVQSTGHADLVQSPDGDWHMVFLATRPRGGTPGFHVLGRETFCTSVQWIDGWPAPAALGVSALSQDSDTAARVVVRDDFDGDRLAPEWISVRRPAESFGGLTAAPGRLSLNGDGNTLDDPLPVFVGRRQQHPHASVRALMDAAHGRGGLAVRIDERHHYEIEAGDGRVRCTARVGPFTSEFGDVQLAAAEVLLRIDTVPSGLGFTSPCAPPDTIRLGIERGGEFTVLGEIDGRYLSTEVAGGFTGRVIGMFGHKGSVAFDWFEYRDAADDTARRGAGQGA